MATPPGPLTHWCPSRPSAVRESYVSGAPEQREFGVLASLPPLPHPILLAELQFGQRLPCLPWRQILQLCLSATLPLSLLLSLLLPNQVALGASHCCQVLGVIVPSYPELCSPLCALSLPQLSAVSPSGLPQFLLTL